MLFARGRCPVRVYKCRCLVAVGSWIAIIPAVIVVLVFIIRIALEDSFLQKNFPGYRDYVSTVKYRLIPGVWWNSAEADERYYNQGSSQ